MRLLLGLFLLLGLLGLGGPSAHAEPPEAVLDALFGDERRTVALQSLAERESLGPDEGFRVVEVARDTPTSHPLGWLRDREVPPRHDRHDRSCQ